ncbi:MAG: glycosyltransferase family 2 protein [Lentisphaeria bacterium]|nr:glycosyltransferase family 2 protein [Lentisphaeria bacterium]
MPKVSVVIPVYNVEKYIERCVRSLFEQTLDSVEYIFVDDGSPDNSISVMEKVLADYPHRKEQVKIIRHEVNQGVGFARNHGVAASTGDYVIHCDADDWLDLELYEAMYKKAAETCADMVHCGFELCFPSSRRQKFNIPEALGPSELISALLIDQSLGSLCNKMFRGTIARSAKIICPDHIFINEDVLRVAQMLLECKTLAVETEYSYMYRYNPLSASKGRFSRRKLDSIHQAADLMKEVLPQEKFSTAVTELECKNLMYLIRYPEISSSAEFYSRAGKIGKKKIRTHVQNLGRGCCVFLNIALVSYRLSCYLYRIAQPVKDFVRRLTGKDRI